MENCNIKSVIDENKDSILFNQLLNFFPDIDDASYYYSVITNKDNLDSVYKTDLKKDFKKEFSERSLIVGKHVNEIGEPLIHKNTMGEYYLIDANDNFYWLDIGQLNYDYTTQKYLVDVALYELFSENIIQNKPLLENVSFEKLYNENSYINSLLNKNQIKSLEKLITRKLNDIAINVNLDRESLEGDPNEIQNTRVLDFRQVFEKNSKDNASANIKMLFNFIPSFRYEIINGVKTLIPNTTKIDMGFNNKVEVPKFENYETIYNKFLTTLADTTVENSGDIVTDTLFETMVNKMRLNYPNDATVNFLLDIIENYDDIKRTEFVQAMNLGNMNHQSTLINENEEVSIINSSDTNSASLKLKKEWDNHFINKFFKYDVENNKHVYNRKKAIETAVELRNFINEIENTKIYSDSLFNNLHDILNKVGIKISKESLIDFLNSKMEENEETYLYAIKKLTKRLTWVGTSLIKTNDNILISYGTPNNPLTIFDKNNKDVGANSFIKELLDYELKNKSELEESTIKGAKGKTYWKYSLKSHLQDFVNRIKSGYKSILPLQKGFYTNSIYIKKIKNSIDNNTNFYKNIKVNTFGNFKTKKNNDKGEDNRHITKPDQLIDYINKTLASRGNGKSQFYTPMPADKSTLHHIEGFDLVNVSLDEKNNLNKEVVNLFSAYALNEIYRSIDEYKLIKTEKDRENNKHIFVKDYHFKLKDNEPFFFYYKKDGKEILTNDQTIKNVKPVGNAFKSYLFPTLNFFQNPKITEGNMRLFSEDGKLAVTSDQFKELTYKLVNKRLKEIIEKDKLQFENSNLIDDNSILGLDKSVKQYYNNIDSIIADFSINSLIANIEYSLLVMGDWAEAKNLIDLSKRYPSTQTTGNYLALQAGDKTHFNLATLPNIERDSLNIRKLRTQNKNIAKAYSGINVTDAQGYITWERWKFLMQRGNHWTDEMAKVVNKIENDPDSVVAEDWKYTAQPIKGVFSGKNENGHFTYVKYSALPLIPHVIKGTKLELLSNRMKENSIDEAVVVDGIKLGAKIPAKISNSTKSFRNIDDYILEELSKYDNENDFIESLNITKNEKQELKNLLDINNNELEILSNTDILDVIKSDESIFQSIEESIDKDTREIINDISDFNISKLRNDQYKIQQDLTPKGNKQTLLGSQLIKNILEAIENDVKLKSKLGKEVKKDIINSLVDLSNKGRKKLNSKLGLNENGDIIDTDKFYNELSKHLQDKNNTDDLIRAINRKQPLDLIPNKRILIQQAIQSIIKKETIDIKTNGGTYIQASSWGIDDFIDQYDIEKLGIKLLTNINGLRPPEIITKKNGKKIVKTGQVFVSSQYISKLIPNWKKLSNKQLKELFKDERLKTIIGYRIPNQGLSSTDSFEIVGILPESMGDTIIPYADITAKTGSDFDIDKIFTILPNIKVKYKKDSINSIFNYLNDINITKEDILEEYNFASDIISYDIDYINSLSLNQLKTEFINDFILNNNIKDNLYRDNYLKEINSINEIESLEYIEYDNNLPPNEQSKEAVENKLIESLREVLEAPLLYEKLIKSIDSDFLKNDINRVSKIKGIEESTDSELDVNFFTASYQVDKKFDNSLGKDGTGLKSNQLVDIPLSQMADLKLKKDLLIAPVKNDKTSFNRKLDAINEFEITEIESWFLSANVDIAKDPFISKGNHNTYTSNISSMLNRAGTPIKIINALMQQEIIEKYVKEKDNRKSKIAKQFFNSVKEQTIISILSKYNFEYDPEFVKNIKYKNLKKDLKKLRDNNNYSGIQKLFEKYIKLPKEGDSYEKYLSNQLGILDFFIELEESAEKLSESVLSTKQDVNGSGNTLITSIIDYNRVEDLKTSDNFENYNKKFENTFLSTFYENSTKLSLKLFEQLFLTASSFSKLFYDEVSKMLTDENLKDKELGQLLESNLYSSIIGYSELSGNKNTIKDFFIGNNTIYSRLYKFKEKYPNSVFFNLLEGNIEHNYKFVKLDNTKNKSTDILNEFTKEWENLLNSDDLELKEFAKDLVKYSYISSGYQSNFVSFYEYAPINYTKELISNAVLDFKSRLQKGEIDYNIIIKKIFRNNWENKKLVPQIYVSTLKNINSFVKNGILHIPKQYSGTYINLEKKPYILLKPQENYNNLEQEPEPTLYEFVGYDNDGNSAYRSVPKLGKNIKGHKIFEYYDLNSLSSALKENNNIDISSHKKIEKLIEVGMINPLNILDKENIKNIDIAIDTLLNNQTLNTDGC